jgi:ribosomal protein L25 (general stress protein Ctc)
MSKPEKKFQAGGIEASVFENEIQHEGKPIKIKKVAFQKRYKGSNGWQTTYSLDLNDVPKAILVLSKAYEFMAMNTDPSVPSEKESPESA